MVSLCFSLFVQESVTNDPIHGPASRCSWRGLRGRDISPPVTVCKPRVAEAIAGSPSTAAGERICHSCLGEARIVLWQRQSRSVARESPGSEFGLTFRH